jgi:itaconyl-CoA hydratase
MTDNVWQSLISMNQHPIHIDEEYAKQTEFKKILVSSLVTFNIINGMTVNSMSFNAIANLGWDEVRLTKPVFVGDTLYAQSEVLHVRKSKSRAGQGIVTIKTTGLNQRNEIVVEFKRTFLSPQASTQKD